MTAKTLFCDCLAVYLTNCADYGRIALSALPNYEHRSAGSTSARGARVSTMIYTSVSTDGL
jgi:hypothetical protein